MTAIYNHCEQLTDNIYSFYFETELPLQYTAGQFTQMTLSHNEPDNRGIKRWFTLSSSPTEDMLSITTKIASTHGSTFKQALQNLKPGDSIGIDEPMGDFVLPKHPQTPLVFIAGGIGITPFRSMFRWLADTGNERPIKFLYAVRSEDEIVFQRDLNEARVHSTIVVSNPSDAWGGERGKLTAEQILGLEKPAEDSLIYMSGPEPMLVALSQDLVDAGIHKSQLVTDFFPGYEKI
ncbi:MAG TPA: FAD-dependent oxidoreductase [Candidatus Saccharimonadales bacterium]|nr:FAD-dependent oxidoreductase [Candidatus Saccharimonadales bacterium]